MARTDTWVDVFIDTSFRDSADEDYIAARVAYRLELTHTFHWSSLQAVEKYIKAILLYNRGSTVGLGHNVSKGFRKLQQIPDIPFVFPADIKLFVDYINEEGPNRYRGFPAELQPDALVGLDRTVWHLRRYCYSLNAIASDQGRLAKELAALNRDPLEYRHKFKIPGGFLERVLARPSERRRNLVWKNFWYGSRRRKVIKAFPQRFECSRPVHFMRPEVYFAIKDLVQFERAAREHFEKTSRPGASTK